MPKEVLKLNGVRLLSLEPRDIVTAILHTFPDIHYWSPDGLRQLWKAAFDVALEFVKTQIKNERGSKRSALTRFRKRAEWKLWSVRRSGSSMLTRVYNEMLANEGHGLLRGFGFANKLGQPILGNAEVQPCILFQPYQDSETISNQEEEVMSELEFTKKELKDALEDVNETLDLGKTSMSTKGGEEELLERLTKAALQKDGEGNFFITDKDEVNKKTRKIIDAIRENAEEDEEKPKKKAKAKAEAEDEEEEKPKKKAKDEDDEEKPKAKTKVKDEDEEKPKKKAKDEDEDEDGEKSLADQVAECSKLKLLKQMVEDNSEFKKLRKKLDDYKLLEGFRELKNDMYEALGVEPPKKKAPKKKEETGPRYTRLHAVADALKEGKTTNREKLVQRSSDLFAEHGGHDNLREQKADFERASKLLTALGLAKDNGKEFEYTPEG